MIEIIKFTYKDDSRATACINVKVCSSIPCAKVLILDEINMGFGGNWMSLSDAANDLKDELEECEWLEKEKIFVWADNGKKEVYFIGRINEREINTKWQNIAVI